ncbi:MAG TPA: di-heme oxidoredictase family protein, partial [Thermoanaerobaculia bacterium]|nr:di-heme oxidoredictase family protein [Thermoanaerobaculia bacterium]
RGEVANDEFTTARLWGVADTAPYLHDGRATTLEEAIEFHGGEAQGARDAFLALGPADRDELLVFLGKLRTPKRPNEELIQE